MQKRGIWSSRRGRRGERQRNQKSSPLAPKDQNLFNNTKDLLPTSKEGGRGGISAAHTFTHASAAAKSDDVLPPFAISQGAGGGVLARLCDSSEEELFSFNDGSSVVVAGVFSGGRGTQCGGGTQGLPPPPCALLLLTFLAALFGEGSVRHIPDLVRGKRPLSCVVRVEKVLAQYFAVWCTTGSAPFSIRARGSK